MLDTRTQGLQLLGLTKALTPLECTFILSCVLESSDNMPENEYSFSGRHIMCILMDVHSRTVESTKHLLGICL